MRLYCTGTKKIVKVGDIATTYRGDKVEVLRKIRPHKVDSSGKVEVRDLKTGHTGTYYVGVIDAEWR